MSVKYSHFFDIDPEYFPVVDETVIKNQPDLWKKYYPHETFVRLINTTVKVLARIEKKSIWVEGAYGTGKSHAVLTLKKLLDASPEETREYFKKFENNLTSDLFNKFQTEKNSGTILTVHRYGSSDVIGDQSLVYNIQESIETALKEKGIKNKVTNSLKNTIINYFKNAENKESFNVYVKGSASNIFGGENIDTIIDELNTYDGIALQSLIEKILKVGQEHGITDFKMNVDELTQWIKDVIHENNLKAIVFIWDEFTEYFFNNKNALTGFQKIAEISINEPFYLMIVTHKSAALFDDGEKNQMKILNRFVEPTCLIELPENMAFQLMGAAMEKKNDSQVLQEWNEVKEELYDFTGSSRGLVKNRANISDKELAGILPIHPYSALLLKHISSAFVSNQRSMFDFIKTGNNEDTRGFQWFIENYGPYDQNPLLTVDMLWDFFYTRNKEHLDNQIRTILDCFALANTRHLDLDEQRVLKAILLLQAISQNVGDSVELFIPNQQNINNIFEGSDLDAGQAGNIAEKLVKDEILYKRNIGGGNFQYSTFVNNGDRDAIEKLKDEIRKSTTTQLIQLGAVNEAFTLPKKLDRYIVAHVSSKDFESKIKELRNQQSTYPEKLFSIVCYSKDDDESNLITKKITDATKSGDYDFVFISTLSMPLGKDNFEQYVENMANSKYQNGKDNQQARQYEMNAKDYLKKWRNRISNGDYVVYTVDQPEGINISSSEKLYEKLLEIDVKHYPDCLEGAYKVNDPLYISSQMKLGVELGAKQETSGLFKSTNPATKLENALEGAWGVEDYWIESPSLLISRIKKCVDGLIYDALDKDGRIAISSVYDVLKTKPYGFMPCNLTAFIMGFILKEYADGSFSWSDGINNDILTIDKLKEMVEEILKNQQTPNARYKEKYIVSMTEDEKAFNEASSLIFSIPKSLCTSVEQTRDHIRNKMKELSFPVWSVKYILSNADLATDESVIKEIIDLYCGIANKENVGGNNTETDIAQRIGHLCIENKNAVRDLQTVITKDNCTLGMIEYVKSIDEGILVSLSKEIVDNGQYINALKQKFDADAANWVWNVTTANNKIQEVILEYKIIAESNNYISKSNNFFVTISEWCEKCSNIKISFHASKNHLDELTPFMELLYDIKKSGSLIDSKKQSFYEQLKSYGRKFDDFYNNQIIMFKKVCDYLLYKYSDEDISEIFKLVQIDSYTLDKNTYFKNIENNISLFEQNSSNLKLKNLWRERTDTDTPREWSKKYKMPILAIIDDDKIQSARKAFGALNRSNPDKITIDNAINFLENANFFEKLQSQEERDKAFTNTIIKNYAAILTNVNEVKDYIAQRMSDTEPYDWFALPEVEKYVKQLAEKKYIHGGSDIALSIIDNMDESDVKRYLKDLIKDNMAVGIEIIKEN